MKIKEIGTVVIAGILSLAALVLLEVQDQTPESSIASAEIPQSIDFEDTSSLIEPSLPAPTAEPPAVDEAEETEESAATAPEYDLSQGPVPGITAPEPEAKPDNDSANESVLAAVEPDADAAEESMTELADLIEGAPKSTPSKSPSTSLVGIDPESDTIPTAGPAFDDSFAEAVQKATGELPVNDPASGNTDPDAEPASIIEETPNGFWLRQAKLNDVFQHLAQLGNHQYFHNAELEGPSFVVTGQLMDDDPVTQMEELALMYGVTIHKKGNTVYALTGSQLSTLPTEPFRYSLKYLRPSDIEQIKLILQPFLTPGSGIIEYETKTNTLIVMDNERKLDALAHFLEQIDQPRQQVAIETRILRITSGSTNRVGVDWSSMLGEQGVSIDGIASLNSLFNLPDFDDAVAVATGTSDSELVLSPVELNAVLRALNEGGLAQQESSPTLITEDNEEGLISIIDRIPIITATITETDAGQNVTEVVRYKIDETDPTGDPAETREVGVSIAVTPTILPDNTIRMALRPRSAQVVEFVEAPSGNFYPRVNESSVTTTARVPNGHSLLIGGFYEEVQTDSSNKVPFLGDLPAVNLLFKSKERSKEHTSLVFIVTPKLYTPSSELENDLMSHEIHDSHVLPNDHDYPDRDTPGQNYSSNLRNTVNNTFRKYEPDSPSNLLHPSHPYNLPQSQPIHGKDGSEEPQFEQKPSVTVRSANSRPRNGGFLGKVFGGNKSKHNR